MLRNIKPCFVDRNAFTSAKPRRPARRNNNVAYMGRTSRNVRGWPKCHTEQQGGQTPSGP
eukprot:4533134-Heterocapsa_arctica.AAC.1